jgi:demethylmenaquinone methyltransferase/2-methoxy-6-polyprenyl-1,4-benzoquinol methylase
MIGPAEASIPNTNVDACKPVSKSTIPDDVERVPRTEQEAAASYTRLSKWYDRFGGSEEPHIAEGLRLLDVQPGKRVLEVGFGTGRSLIALAHAVGSTGQVIGIDLSPGMIAVAREQVSKAPSCPSAGIGHPDAGFPLTARGNDVVTFHRGSALHLPYATASFDAVFSSFTLDLIDTPDIPIVLGEMRRVLKPGGRVGLVSMSKSCEGNVVVKVYERFHRWLPMLIDCRPIYLQSALESAGLHCEVHQTRSMWGIPVEIVIAPKC